MSTARPERYTLRQTSSVVTFWAGCAVLAVAVGTPLAIGAWRVLGFVVAPSLLLAWVLWMLLYRPLVRYDATRLVVVNPGRVHELPWPRVTAVVQRLSLVVEVDGRKPLTAWGAPYPRRTGNLAGALDRRSRTPYDFDANAKTLEAYRAVAPPSDEPVVSRWDAVPLLIGAVLVIATAATLALV